MSTTFNIMVRRTSRLALTIGLAATVTAAAIAGGTADVASAARTTGPTTLARAAALATPGVVLIDSRYNVAVRLRYQDTSKISGFAHLDRTYTVGDWTGTGFVVTPDGAVVTASHVVDPPKMDLRHYAVNKLFEGLGYSFPNPMDAYRITDNHVLNSLLQQCYRGVACSFKITPRITVYPAVALGSDIVFPRAMQADVLTRTGVQRTDVAVLHVNGHNMPTVELAKSALSLQAGTHLDVLGFPGSVLGNSSNGVTTPTLVPVTVSSVRPGWGSGEQIQVQGGVEHGESGGPVLDREGRVVGLVSYGVGSTDNFLRTVDDIHAALADAGIRPTRGPIDTAYERAMDLYWHRHYTAAVLAFRHVTDLDATNPLAQRYLAESAQRAGTSADVPLAAPTSGSASPLGGAVGKVLGAAAVVAAIAGALTAYVRNRRRPNDVLTVQSSTSA